MEKNLRRIANKILFEDTWNKYGSEYMQQNDGEENEELPVDASDVMPNRLAIEIPPVEDSEYIPSNPPDMQKKVKNLQKSKRKKKLPKRNYNLI